MEVLYILESEASKGPDDIISKECRSPARSSDQEWLAQASVILAAST